MTMGWVFDLPGARTPSSKIEQPFRPLVSIEFDPSLAVKFAVETSCQSAESESNSQPGLRSHMPLMRGLLPTAISAALPKLSEFGFSELCRNTPRFGMTVLRRADSSLLHPGAHWERGQENSAWNG